MLLVLLSCPESSRSCVTLGEDLAAFKYAVLPWYGRRVTLAAYVPRGVIDSLSAFRSDLSLLGFVLRVFPRVSRQEVNQPKSSSGREIAYV